MVKRQFLLGISDRRLMYYNGSEFMVISFYFIYIQGDL